MKNAPEGCAARILQTLGVDEQEQYRRIFMARFGLKRNSAKLVRLPQPQQVPVVSMRRAALIITIAALAVLGMTGAAFAAPASMELLARAADPNPNLRSYTATADLAATLHGPIPLHKSFHGIAYYLKPQRKIVFENVSGPLSRFRELTATTPSYEELLSTYAVTPLEDDGVDSVYLLAPKKAGARVSSITVTVNDSTALVSRILWKYTNGGVLSTEQTYATMQPFHVISTETISAHFPGYNVDGTLRFSDFQLNAAIDPSIFSTQ